MKKLNEMIDKSGFKLGFIAQKLGITYVALHNKLVGKRSFTLDEALILKDLLNISEAEFKEIFSGSRKTIRK